MKTKIQNTNRINSPRIEVRGLRFAAADLAAMAHRAHDLTREAKRIDAELRVVKNALKAQVPAGETRVTRKDTAGRTLATYALLKADIERCHIPAYWRAAYTQLTVREI
jgi:hypothetical protein